MKLRLTLRGDEKGKSKNVTVGGGEIRVMRVRSMLGFQASVCSVACTYELGFILCTK